VIAVDTNILVYAERLESPWFEAAERALSELAESSAPWAIPWPCIHEFFSVVTNPRIWKTPTPPAIAVSQIGGWMESPGLVLLAEGPRFWTELKDVLRASGVAGGRVHDARIAAICRQHGISTLWSADRDFSRFAGLKTSNPLLR
jgi:toxin-antitoxin system PIN domain toxin